jgi:hypothetical protein|tara:strand:+ start:425 stop:1066 length:642 start_codon:yes stop_codon:yes gene_type:complete
MDITSFLITYIGIGLATLLGVLGVTRKERAQERCIQEWRNGLATDAISRSRIPDISLNILTALAILLLWPAALVMAARQLAARSNHSSSRMAAPEMSDEEVYAEFIAEERAKLPTNRITITRESLCQATSIQEIEKTWTVRDPAAGDDNARPFGLRNKSWSRFVGMVSGQESAKLWLFEIVNSDVWELRNRVLRGVVLEQHGTLGDYYLFEIL